MGTPAASPPLIRRRVSSWTMPQRSHPRRPAVATPAVVFAATASALVGLIGPPRQFAAMPQSLSGNDAPSGPEFKMGELPKMLEKGDKIPKEKEMYRTIENPRQKKSKYHQLPWYYGKHPCPDEKVLLDSSLPGGVTKQTKREAQLRHALRKGEKPQELFDKTIQVFAQRARQEVRWLSAQRREFLRRAKRWANEMVLQGLTPSDVSFKLLLLGCASVGNAEAAEYWFQEFAKVGSVGRLEYNAVIGAYGQDGFPAEVRKWILKMREAGLQPDARSYAALVEAWEKMGNRKRMLEAVAEYQAAEVAGGVGEPLDPRDKGLPYYAMARTYAKLADAPRAISVLKVLQAKEIPLSREAHRIRLEVLLKTPGPRRNPEQIERALHDLLLTRPNDGPLYQSKFSRLCRQALGDDRYESILKGHGTSDAELVPELPDAQAMTFWRRSNIVRQLNKPKMGQGALKRSYEDSRYAAKRSRQMESSKPSMGEVAGGVRIAGERGLPEWMTIPMPQKYGA